MTGLLVIATGNAGKLGEFRRFLCQPAVDLELRPQPEGLEVEETGASFAANARLKAEAVARATGEWTLADDSGLSVEALGGEPGIRSARYAPTDPERIARLLRELEAANAIAGPAGKPGRQARFTAALAVADPSGRIALEVEGICEGEILSAPQGTGGFGYDPVFYVPELMLSFAEMDPEQKRRVGHRGQALRVLLPRLAALLSMSSARTD
ncbi:RdgB/HAM1 family non-canonical purine NTP pyrophosphatase [Synechococcus sp. Tobar12-5m-g]|uniref:RdgB/HAM1 family non-canonical purine NTP pyrophosphatase n=1 Tax=unclassified Synechococcus TaxID=2626047 RepID=UPI0020CE7977|nr:MULTISPECIES: RdgB/HAM1 family non-canonical purine NTP pyrophosphatase [unclassified Synechococcus]MCP9772040.1 RdgB/HAM1 family non-canonical purine NTP pyrophosphatase [Synechococcus sp. Tobar12-5m-g]MCP9872982.1 RdgB/HAM1 family non-canonical purine NTP pyrophosphatase [Synechococcus sp. Cruz CV-v-12]